VVNDISREASSGQASRFLRDFMELQMRVSPVPLELAKRRNQIDVMRFGNGSKRYNVFSVIYNLMELLYPENQPTMGELSRAASLPLSTTTRMIDFLVEIGDCQRIYDTNDRRIVRVSLTDNGRLNMQTSQQYFAQHGQEILSVLTAEEQTTFLTLFNKVATAFRQSESTL
jgi:DNA-binding MarR family transcriptional regulator